MAERRYSTIGGTSSKGGGIPGISRDEQMGFAIAGVLGLMVGAVIHGYLGAVVGAAIAGGTFFILMLDAGKGSLGARLLRVIRWSNRGRRGTDRYVPWDPIAWEMHLNDTNVLNDKDARAMRYRPDFADGMAWLVAEPRQPGVAWQVPRGREEFLSATWSVEGRLRGLESDEAMDEGAAAWGRFLASFGGMTSLPRYVQTLTRVLPPDLAWHDRWVDENMDKSAPTLLQDSYLEVLQECERGALIQRHFVTVRWPVSEQFKLQASHFGAEQDGWRALMHEEVQTITRLLEVSHMGAVKVLTARQTAAVMLHIQDPDRAIDRVDDVDAERMGLPSRDTRRAVVVAQEDGAGEWWHATGMMRSEDLAIGTRNSFWLHGVLAGMRQPIVRSVSFHARVVPASEARRRAEADARGAEMELYRAQKKGQLTPLDMLRAREAAEAKRRALEPGTMAHGIEWVGYLSVSARGPEDLLLAKRLIEEQAQNALGLDRIQWCDTMQSAALGSVMPLARGLTNGRTRASTRVMAGVGRLTTEGVDK